MKKSFNRRDFLKIAGMLPLSLATPRFLKNVAAKNILIIVFDALTAYNISLYGYPRETMPHLSNLAERAIVYHRHYAGGNFTTTGTATLLTGTNAWTHRALQQNSAVAEQVAAHNIFAVFKDYHRLAYTHNGWVTTLLRQFKQYIEEWIPREELMLASYGNFIPKLFPNDEDAASVGWDRNVNLESGFSYSLFLSRFYHTLQEAQIKNIYSQYPRKIPSVGTNNYFVMEQATEWLSSRLTEIPQPFFGYFHFLPPHAPYRTSIEFFNSFAKDKFRLSTKPASVFGQNYGQGDLSEQNTEYDEFILYVDNEFRKFYKVLESSGVLENTILVLTSDHGEMNDRGIRGHLTSAMYEPLIRIPLLIFDPDRKERLDVHTPTSAVDILPTLLHLTEQSIPNWVEGSVLPPFSSAEIPESRSLYATHAIHTPQDQPIKKSFSVSLVKGRYKLHYYYGYEEIQGGELMHLFDIESDPEELNDQSETHQEVKDELLAELKAKLMEINQPYL